MDLIEFRRAMRRFLGLGLVAGILVLGVGILTVGRHDPQYSATSTVLLNPKTDRFQLASSSLLRVILPNVVVLAESDSLRSDAASQVRAAVRDTPVTVGASVDVDTSVLAITATSTDAAAAAQWSAASAEAVVKRLADDDLLSGEVIDLASTAVPDGRTRQRVGIAGSLGLALVAFVLIVFVAQRVTESRDVAAALRKRGVRVLGDLSSRGLSSDPGEMRVAIAGIVMAVGATASRVVVTAFDDAVLVRAFTGMFVDEARLAAGSSLDGGSPAEDLAVPGPLIDQLVSLQAVVGGQGACLVLVDRRRSSVDEVVAGMVGLHAMHIPAAGVVLVRGPGAEWAARRSPAGVLAATTPTS
jgi:hypothetical protein